mgnify:CR=1 FL=1
MINRILQTLGLSRTEQSKERIDIWEAVLEIQLSLSNMENLNCGGCGFFAKLMSDELRRLGQDHRIVYINDRRVGTTRKRIKEVMVKGGHRVPGIAADHVLIRIGDTWFDGHSTFGKPPLRTYGSRYVGNVSNQQLEVALERGHWNSSFDRKKDGAKVRKVVRSVMRRVHPIMKTNT